MNREFEKTSEMIGLEEINQTEGCEVNGGALIIIVFKICCHSIPSADSDPFTIW